MEPTGLAEEQWLPRTPLTEDSVHPRVESYVHLGILYSQEGDTAPEMTNIFLPALTELNFGGKMPFLIP